MKLPIVKLNSNLSEYLNDLNKYFSEKNVNTNEEKLKIFKKSLSKEILYDSLKKYDDKNVNFGGLLLNFKLAIWILLNICLSIFDKFFSLKNLKVNEGSKHQNDSDVNRRNNDEVMSLSEENSSINTTLHQVYHYNEIILNNNRDPFNILYMNIRSLNAKTLNLLKEKLETFDYAIEAIVLSETNLNDSDDGKYELEDYKSFNSIRSDNKSGGVSIYIKNEFSTKLLYQEYANHSNYVVVKIRDYDINLIGIYRGQNGSKFSFKQRYKHLMKIYPKSIIIGDININIYEERFDFYNNEANIYGFNVLNETYPTRRNGDNPTIIDHIVTDLNEKFSSKVFIIERGISDHNDMLISFSLNHINDSIDSISYDNFIEVPQSTPNKKENNLINQSSGYFSYVNSKDESTGFINKTSRKLKIYYQSMHRFTSNDVKSFQINSQSQTIQYDIVILTKTNTKSKDLLKECLGTNFKYFSLKYSNKNFNGILIAIRSDIGLIIEEYRVHSKIEQIWIKIYTKNCENSVYLCVCDIPCDQKNLILKQEQHGKYFEQVYEDIQKNDCHSKTKAFYLFGDFNLPELKWFKEFDKNSISYDFIEPETDKNYLYFLKRLESKGFKQIQSIPIKTSENNDNLCFGDFIFIKNDSLSSQNNFSIEECSDKSQILKESRHNNHYPLIMEIDLSTFIIPF